jgi:DNA polymerase-3 subunit beta
MEFSTDAGGLASALASIKGAVEKRSTLPILASVLLSLEGDALTLTGTNLELELKAARAVAGARNGAVSASAERLLALCRALPEGAEVRLKLEDDCLRVTSGRSKFKLLTMPAENFPAFDGAGMGEPITVPAATLSVLLHGASYAMAKGDVRYYLNGILLEIDPGELRLVASDGHRLALASAVLELPALGKSCVVPCNSVAELHKLLSGGGDVALAVSGNALRVTLADGTVFSTKLIEGKFPDWRRVLPTQFRAVFDVARVALIEALKRVAITASDAGRAVHFDLTTDGVALSSGQEDTAEDFVPGTLDGDPVALGFNAGYLLDALAHLEGETARISIAQAGNSALIVDPESELSRHVVMPMRI